MIDAQVIENIRLQQEKDRKARVREDLKEVVDKYSTNLDVKVKMLERVIREEKEDEAEDAVERNGQNHN